MFLLNIVIECEKSIIVGIRPYAWVLSASGGLHPLRLVSRKIEDAHLGNDIKLPF